MTKVIIRHIIGVGIRERKVRKIKKIIEKELLYFVMLMLLIGVLYFGLSAINATILWTMNDNVKRVQQFIAMLLSGMMAYFIFRPVIKKKLKSRLVFSSTIILAVIVGNIFRATVTPFSAGYISLIVVATYLLIMEE